MSNRHRPRQSKYESEEEFAARLRAHELAQPSARPPQERHVVDTAAERFKWELLAAVLPKLLRGCP